MYDVHLGLIGKRVVDFLLVLIVESSTLARHHILFTLYVPCLKVLFIGPCMFILYSADLEMWPRNIA